MEVQEAFEQFEAAVRSATADRRSPEKKKTMALCLRKILVVTGKTEKDLPSIIRVDRTTIGRWLAGESIPHRSQRENLRRVLSPDSLEETFSEDGFAHLVMRILTDIRYRPIVKFIAESPVSVEEAETLFRIARISKGILTPGTMNTLIGRE